MIGRLSHFCGPGAVELLVPMDLKASVATFMEPLIRSFQTPVVAEFVVAYVAAGGASQDVVGAGMLAAAMSDHDAAFEALLETAADLAPTSGLAWQNVMQAAGAPI